MCEVKSYNTKNTQLVSLRLPTWLIEDIKELKKDYPTKTMTDFIVFATAKDIQRYKVSKNG